MTTIPFYDGPPQTKSHTGYLEVRPEVNGHLWFWFFEHSTNPDTAPLAIWLNGGKLDYCVLGILHTVMARMFKYDWIIWGIDLLSSG